MRFLLKGSPPKAWQGPSITAWRGHWQAEFGDYPQHCVTAPASLGVGMSRHTVCMKWPSRGDWRLWGAKPISHSNPASPAWLHRLCSLPPPRFSLAHGGGTRAVEGKGTLAPSTSVNRPHDPLSLISCGLPPPLSPHTAPNPKSLHSIPRVYHPRRGQRCLPSPYILPFPLPDLSIKRFRNYSVLPSPHQ